MFRQLLARNSFRAVVPRAQHRYFSASQVTSGGDLGFSSLGMNNDKIKVFRNPTYDELLEHELANKEGVMTSTGSFAVDTGKFTGRSPGDKYIVKQQPSEDNIWWGPVNQPMTEAVFDELYAKVTDHYNKADQCYVFDGFCGANPKSRKNVRFITEMAWQSHFVRNMFMRPKEASEIANFAPDYTIINACKVVDDDYKKHGTNSEVFVAFNVEKRVAIIGGTWYGGEMKKGIFSMMNYWLPLEGTMACTAVLTLARMARIPLSSSVLVAPAKPPLVQTPTAI